jgi:2'-5' RNA ligase
VVARRRVAVALLLPEPWATEVDGIRRGLGDGAFTDVAPHITLVHPVNIRDAELPAACALLRVVAGGTDPFTVRIGPPATFAPVTPTAYLDVHGDGAAVVHRLHRELRAEPFVRPAVHEFVPHVTISNDCPPDRMSAAMAALADYEVDVTCTTVSLLEHRSEGPHLWNPIADVVLGSLAVVGRGGYELELCTSTLAPHPQGAEPFVVTARHDGEVVGSASGWLRDGEAQLVELVGDEDVERHLLARVRTLVPSPGVDRA